MKIIKRLKKFVAPRQTNETSRRQELILNILLTFSLAGFFILNIIRICDYILYVDKRGLNLGVTLFIMMFFACLLWLSRRGRIKLASALLLATFFLPMAYSFLVWGADLPAGLLLAVLVITLSGILLGARVAFASTLLISLIIIFITEFQMRGLIPVQSYWREEPAQIGDALSYVILLFIIATIAWLFCRTINHSLRRAQQSELLLREERDSLEIKVEARTKEIEELQTEKINQLYRFAEFGRLSSGIFHDLINPLTAVSLNLEQIKTEADSKILSAKSYLSQALLATSKMESLISSIKKQISRESVIEDFSLNQESKQIIEILSYKAHRAQVNLKILTNKEIILNNDAIKFGQVITNLLANAIEACDEQEVRDVNLSLIDKDNEIEIIVADSGGGIKSENLAKIFEPFFSTKKITGQGLGLGLASTKNIIEKDFGGRINVSSCWGKGTVFTIILPKS